MPTPEQLARQNIDALLAQCGGFVQSRNEMNLGAERGSAVRASPLKTGFADCLLFVGLSATPPAWHSPLPYLYESTVVERFFTNGLDPQPPHVCVPSTRDAGRLG